MSTDKLNVFGCGTDFSCEFGLDMVILVGFGDFFIEGIGFAGLVTDGAFVHVFAEIINLKLLGI